MFFLKVSASQFKDSSQGQENLMSVVNHGSVLPSMARRQPIVFNIVAILIQSFFFEHESVNEHCCLSKRFKA